MYYKKKNEQISRHLLIIFVTSEIRNILCLFFSFYLRPIALVGFVMSGNDGRLKFINGANNFLYSGAAIYGVTHDSHLAHAAPR